MDQRQFLRRGERQHRRLRLNTCICVAQLRRGRQEDPIEIGLRLQRERKLLLIRGKQSGYRQKGENDGLSSSYYVAGGVPLCNFALTFPSWPAKLYMNSTVVVERLHEDALVAPVITIVVLVIEDPADAIRRDARRDQVNAVAGPRVHLGDDGQPRPSFAAAAVTAAIT